jgi:phospholipid/cholesterol/gamma-HCH transport system substrate-binding protein
MLKSVGTELKVGIFAALAISTLLYMLIVLVPETFEDREYKRFYTVLQNAAGIIVKSHVKTNGVTVGKVLAIDLKNNMTRVELDIDASVTIPVGSKIEVRSVGLLGDVHLEILRARDNNEYIEEGGFIPQSEDSTDIQALIGLVGDIARDIKKVTTVLAKTLGTERGEEAVGNIVGNIESVTTDLRATTRTLKKVIGDRDDDLQDIVTNIRDGVADLRDFSSGLREILDQENRERIDRILASFDETMVDVKGSARSINLIAEKVENGEGTIGRLVNDEETLTELESAIKDIRKVIAPATRLSIDVDYHNELAREGDMNHYFNMVFRTRPDKYYLLGIIDKTSQIVQTKTETLSDTPATTDQPASLETKETITKEEALKFNLQFAKRWYFFAVRFGLFETTGGFATDFYLLGDTIRLTIEAYDWDTRDKTIRRTAHLKAYASVLFYNHIYILAGVDDPTRTDPETGKVHKDVNYFLGAGLTFNDEDLKAIFGTAALAL